MSHVTRIVVVAAVLAGGLALVAPLHASPFQGTQPAAGTQSGTLSWSADLWSGDWLLHLLQRIWTKAGATLDPSGGSVAAHNRLPTGRGSHSLSN